MRRIVNEFGMVVLALVLAVVVWIVAMQAENPIEQGEFSDLIEVRITNQPEETTLFPQFSETVKLTIRAPKSSWQSLRADKFTAWVDLSGRAPGEYEMKVQISCTDDNVVIVDLVPATVPVYLRKQVSREMTVQVQLYGTAALGYEIKREQMVVDPLTVTVTGPESIIAQIVQSTVSLDIGQDVKDIISARRIVIARQSDGNSVGSFVTIEPSTVGITVPVEQKTGFKEMAVRPVVIGSPASGYRLRAVSVEPATVMLGGDPSAVEKMAVAGYAESVPLNIAGATGDVVERLALNLPEGISAVGVQGVKVTASIEPIPERRTINISPIVKGLSADLSAQVSPDQVSVTLNGPLPRLNSLKENDVQVYVELVEKGVGKHSIALTYLVPEGIEVESVVPAAVDVQVSPVTPTPLPSPTPTRTPTWTPTSLVTATVTETVGITLTMTPTASKMPLATQKPSATGTPRPVSKTTPIPTLTPTPVSIPTKGGEEHRQQ